MPSYSCVIIGFDVFATSKMQAFRYTGKIFLPQDNFPSLDNFPWGRKIFPPVQLYLIYACNHQIQSPNNTFSYIIPDMTTRTKGRKNRSLLRWLHIPFVWYELIGFAIADDTPDTDCLDNEPKRRKIGITAILTLNVVLYVAQFSTTRNQKLMLKCHQLTMSKCWHCHHQHLPVVRLPTVPRKFPVHLRLLQLIVRWKALNRVQH